jgi:purine-binding chemotaxis protein CheW
VESAQEHVVVRLGGSRYGLVMDSVAEVGRLPGLTRVPGLPDWVAGAANWRGRVLAVLDLRALLGGHLGPLDRAARMVVLSSAGVAVGLIVEDVEGTLEVSADAVEPALLHLPARTASLLGGQVTDGEGPCALLDLAAVFALADELPRARRAG